MEDVRAVVAKYAAGFDPAVVSPADAQRIVEEAAAAENMLATVKAMAAHRLAGSEVWRRSGDASAAHHLARTSGISVTRARHALEAAGHFGDLPALEAAARIGELSAAQVAPIADAASHAPAAEGRLVEAARSASLGELLDVCARTKAAAQGDGEARHRAIHAERFLRRRRCEDGAGELHYRSTLEEMAEIYAVVRAYADRQFRAARAEGRREPGEAYLADGLLEAARAAVAGGGGEPAATDASAVATGTGGSAGATGTGGSAGATGTGGSAGATGTGGSAGANGTGGSAVRDREATGEYGVGGAAGGTAAGSGTVENLGPDSSSAGDTATRAGPSSCHSFADTTPGPVEPGPAPGNGPRVAKGPPVPAKVVVRVDWDALVRGWPTDGEVCEIAGLGPVPVSAVRAMIASGNAFLAAVVTRGVDVVNVAHLGRRATAFQRSALQWRGPSCSVLGCNATEHLEIDHRADWATSRITLLGLLDAVCGHHHDLKTNEGWALVAGQGKRPMVPPDDPRHPRHAAARGDREAG